MLGAAAPASSGETTVLGISGLTTMGLVKCQEDAVRGIQLIQLWPSPGEKNRHTFWEKFWFLKMP